MATLHLMLSEAFGPDVADNLARALDSYINTETPEIYCRQTTKPYELPQFIHAVGQWQLWQGSLGRSAQLFLDRLGYRAVDIVWEDAEHAFERPEITPLAQVASALATARNAVTQSASIIVGLSLPNDRLGTVVVIEDRSPVKIAYAVARFVSRAEEIATVIERAVVTGETPRGPALLTFDDDGGVLVTWNSRADMRAHEEHLPL